MHNSPLIQERHGYIVYRLLPGIGPSHRPVPPSNTPGQLSGSMHLRKEKENKKKHNQKKNSGRLLWSKRVWYFSGIFSLKSNF